MISNVCAMYGSRSDVVSANDKSFKEEVLKHPGVVIVEFYAPWYVLLSWILFIRTVLNFCAFCFCVGVDIARV